MGVWRAFKGPGAKITPSKVPDPNAVPSGNYSPPNNRGLIKQNETADLFAKKGYAVKMLDEIDGGNGYGIKPNSNPDYLIEGKAFDCYTPAADTNTKNIVNTIQKKTRWCRHEIMKGSLPTG